MSAPSTKTKILPFNQRVEIVAAEVSKRLAITAPKHRAATTARLWCKWLAREVA